jgi:hypothetical protein
MDKNLFCISILLFLLITLYLIVNIGVSTGNKNAIRFTNSTTRNIGYRNVFNNNNVDPRDTIIYSTNIQTPQPYQPVGYTSNIGAPIETGWILTNPAIKQCQKVNRYKNLGWPPGYKIYKNYLNCTQ